MLPTGHLGKGYLWGLFFLLEDKQTFKLEGEAVAAGSPYRYPCKAFGGGNPKLLQFLQNPFSLFSQTLVTSFSNSQNL